MSAATDARRDRLRFRAIAGPHREAHAAALADQNLSREGREKVTAPLAARLRDAHHRTDRELGELQATAEGEVQHYHWENVVRRNAASQAAKAAAVAQLAERETAAGILAMAKTADDDPTRHGIALALRGRRDLEDGQHAAIVAALAEPHRERSWRAVSELVGAKVERMRHNLEGPFGVRDLATSDPAKTLAACHEAQTYTDPAGKTVSLSDAAVAEMLKVNGFRFDIGKDPEGDA